MKPLKSLAILALSSASIAFPLQAQGNFDASQPPAITENQAQSEDERSLWLAMEEEEKNVKNSKFLIKDPELNAYISGVLCKTVGDDRCGKARIYIMRTPHFNASMAANGMMVVWSGLLVRARNEAELAAVLGHEFAHFENQHGLQTFVSLRSKTNALKLLSFVPYVGVVGQLGVVSSIFTFSRDMERQSDLAAIGYMKKGGYDPMAASAIWEQLRAEMDATAKERKQQSSKDNNGGFFATHPNSGERMEYLKEAAAKIIAPSDRKNTNEYRAAISKWWPMLIDDQIKLNDFGATDFLLNRIGNEGWTAQTLYARAELYRSRGKKDDFASAADLYQQAINKGNAPPESWRGLGISLIRSGKLAEGQKSLLIYLAKQPEASDGAMLKMMATGQ